MEAYVFSGDKLSFEVLTRCLAAADIKGVERREPTVKSGRSLPAHLTACLAFLDCDAAEAQDLLLYLPAEATVIPFGAHASKKKVGGPAASRFLTKPFSGSQVEKVLKDALLDSINLKPKVLPRANTADSEGLRIAWRRTHQAISGRRAELTQILSAGPAQLRQLLLKKTAIDSDGVPRVQKHDFPLQDVLLIDGDAAAAKQIGRYLIDRCTMQTDIAADGRDAWELLAANTYDAVILEWECKEISGLALYNRLRNRPRTRYTPILVLSSTLKPQDFRLLDEDFCVTLLAKPAQDKTFNAALSEVVCNAVLHKEYGRQLMDFVRAAVSCAFFDDGDALGGDPSDAVLLNALRLGGDSLLAAGDHEHAAAAYAAAWRLGDRRLSLVTGYAKACYLSGNPKQAAQLLKAADVLAPQSVERLCMLGEVDLASKNPDEARSYFKKALAIDGDHEKAKAGLKIADAIAALPDHKPEEPQPVGQFASYLNLVGINLSRGGKTAEALNYYRSAMAFVYGNDNLSKVWFNVGICMLRSSQPEKAKQAFSKALECSEGRLKKAAKYLQKEPAAAASEEIDIEFERF